ncbi:hypothetical protein FEM08_15980 [Flavobacterium gilvum]|nr:hypothetical protein FEM08_15980 [Flavobacterium gilvum]
MRKIIYKCSFYNTILFDDYFFYLIMKKILPKNQYFTFLLIH